MKILYFFYVSFWKNFRRIVGKNMRLQISIWISIPEKSIATYRFLKVSIRIDTFPITSRVASFWSLCRFYGRVLQALFPSHPPRSLPRNFLNRSRQRNNCRLRNQFHAVLLFFRVFKRGCTDVKLVSTGLYEAVTFIIIQKGKKLNQTKKLLSIFLFCKTLFRPVLDLTRPGLVSGKYWYK